MLKNRRILFGVLNWGLGHAARSIPLIRQLQQNNEIIMASDGEALKLLQNEFPHLKFEKLPSYSIRYSKYGALLPFYILWQSPKIWKAITRENKQVDFLIKKHNINQTISDNRYGFYHKNIPSIFITHQLSVLSGITTIISTKIQHHLIKNFDEIWVPDFERENNLSGKLSHDVSIDKKITYLGPVSRFHQSNFKQKYDILAILSGPEPQRSFLEKKLYKEFIDLPKKTAIVQGIIEQETKIIKKNNVHLYNFLLSDALEKLINSSEIIISRSGYTSIMDFYQLKKKVFFIPTPGQSEQNYLARYLDSKKIAPFSGQSDFKIDDLKKLDNYTGFY